MPNATNNVVFNYASLNVIPATSTGGQKTHALTGILSMEDMFRSWMAQQPSKRGGGVYTNQTIDDYCTALGGWLGDPVFSALEKKSAFVYDDSATYQAYKSDVENQPGYAAFNNSAQHDPGRLHSSMELYGEFLADKFVQRIINLSKKISPYLAAIRTKPFILLAGISGTGKSRLVRQLARGCCPEWADTAKTVKHPFANEQKPGNFEIIPVRPNWHDSTELMGYVTRLTDNNKPKYIITPFFKFLVKAWMHKDVPFFLCLDEMNLAPVEQYFAEYLSKIETRRLENGEITTDVLVEFSDEVVDGVLNNLLREIPSLATTKSVIEDSMPTSKTRDKDSLHKLWDEFLVDWPISRLRGITLDEYSKSGGKDTFTYALEAKLSKLGSIWGGSAFKFGIYSRDPNGMMKVYKDGSTLMGTDEYAWYRKYGQTKDAAWNVVKNRIVTIAEAAARGDFAAIDKIDFPHVVKWKIAFLYQDRTNPKIVDIFKKEWIVLLTKDMPKKTSFIDRYLKLNGERAQMDVFEWDDEVLSKRLKEELSSDDDEEGDEEDEIESESIMTQSPIIDMIKRDKGIRIPPNLVVMGTVNMDETTCSFSRKVLDRAMTFELNEVDMDAGLAEDNSVPYGAIPSTAAFAMAVEGYDFYTANKDICDRVKTYLMSLNAVLDGTPFKFAYRSRNEIMLYCIERCKDGIVDLAQALDEATSMKVLSRIEGDAQKLEYVGEVADFKNMNILQVLQQVIPVALKKVNGDAEPVNCSRCLDKLKFMERRLNSGFTNFFV